MMKNKKTIIPIKLRGEMHLLPEYKQCMLFGQVDPTRGNTVHVCDGRITWEHAVIYAGKKIQEKWAIISICEKGHAIDNYQDAGTMNKEMNQWIAYNRATDEELLKYSSPAFSKTKVDERVRLNAIYGPWEQKYAMSENYVATEEKTPEKPFWYPITGPEREMVKKAIKFHEDVYERSFTPFEAIRQMLDSYQILIDNFEEIIDVYPQLYTKINNPRKISNKDERQNIHN